MTTVASPVTDAAAGPDALSVRRVCSSYGPYRALFDVSFRVPAGGVVALVGSNGAGKSTIARTVTGLVTATEGQVLLSGQDVTALPAFKIARLGMAHVVEGRGVFSSLTVEENLTLAFRQRAGRSKLKENLERAYTAFPILGERRKQMGGTLSGGQQRLLSLAKVLVVPSKVLVADELSLGLAPVVVDQVYEGLQRDQPERHRARRRGAAGPPGPRARDVGGRVEPRQCRVRGRSGRCQQGRGIVDGPARGGRGHGGGRGGGGH